MSGSATVEGETGRGIAESVLPGAAQPMRVLLDRALSAFGERPAFRFMGRVTSYAEFNARIEEATGVLRRLGAGPGVRIGLMLPSSPAVAVYTYAAFATGAAVVPLDPEATDKELSDVTTAGRVSLLVTCDLAGVLAKALALARSSGMACVVLVSFASLLPMTSAARMRLFSSHMFARPPAEFPCPIYFERDLLRDKTAETAVARGTGATPRQAMSAPIPSTAAVRSPDSETHRPPA